MNENEVILAHEKHGTFTWRSARALLEDRINDGFWYYDEDAAKAEEALDKSEMAAWKFLESRKDYEYEYVEIQEIN